LLDNADHRQRFIAVIKLGVSLAVLSGILSTRASKQYRCRISGRDVFSLSFCRKTRWIRFFQLAGVWPHIE
jgi:hypothetical protein